MASKQQEALVHSLLERAHSPTSAKRIYAEKVQYRPLLLRPSSPPPADQRQARRAVRQKAKALSKCKPAPLSGRAARRHGLYALPRSGLQYATFAPLKALWEAYALDLLGSDVYPPAGGAGTGSMAGASAAAKLAAAEFHGAEVEVCRSKCTSRVGVRGIVVKDAQQTFELVTKKNKVKVVPKEGTTFRVRVPVPVPAQSKEGEGEEEKQTEDKAQDDVFVFEILGDQFMYRAPDRVNKKFKNHFLKAI
ncbi:putative ribonuclease P protein subunit 1 [Ceratocystis lukuohia]|uniref:Ribonuclease P protein subunit n=1 Tax=Ceratocystis lukuohia TaxID=2019550 RepID=A0ABR4MH08_9PEZI